MVTAWRSTTLRDTVPARPCWADLADSSQECSRDETIHLPAPIVDESYDGPAVGMDNSRDGLNMRLSKADLKAGPIDFSQCSFLMEMGSKDTEKSAASNSASDVADSSMQRSKPLNPEAVAFVPSAPGAPTPCRAMPPPSVPQSGAKAKNRGKRPSSMVKGAAAKRTREMERQIERDGQPQAQPASAEAVSAGPATARRVGQPQPGVSAASELPPASEDDWQHRIRKRVKVVTTIKAMPEYKVYAALQPLANRLDGEPRTPTAEDRQLSKRRWEYEVQQWRSQLKEWVANNGHEDKVRVLSTAATDHAASAVASPDGDELSPDAMPLQ